MILYLDYKQGSFAAHLDLTSNQITCDEFMPGIFEDPSNLITQSTAKIVIHGKPALSAATLEIGRIQLQVNTTTGRNIGPRVYVYYSPFEKDIYRARIYQLDFAVEDPSTFYLRPDRFLRANLTITHGPWEGELTQIPLTNANDTDTLDYLTIQNTLDATNDNTAKINDEDVEGDLPAPTKLIIINDSGAPKFKYYVCNNLNSRPFVFVHCLEGESGAPLVNFVNANASNGNENTVAIGAGVTSITWTITDTIAGYMFGNQFHVIIKFDPAAYLLEGTYMRVRCRNTASTYDYWVGDYVKFPSGGLNLVTQDYGVVQLPPWRVDEDIANASFKLIVDFELGDGEVPYSVYLDAIYLFPVDAFRCINIPTTVTHDSAVVDDMIEDEAYVADVKHMGGTIADREGSVIGVGSEILVYPHRNQRLYFLSVDGVADLAGDESEVKLYYRPLRLAI